MYHKITDSVPVDEYERNSTDFENDLVYFRDHNYQILSMEDLLLLQSGEQEIRLPMASYSLLMMAMNQITARLSLLTKYNMPATFFLVTEWIETSDFMTWSEAWLMSEYLNDRREKACSKWVPIQVPIHSWNKAPNTFAHS